MLGAIIGDIVGSVYELRNHRAKTFRPFFHPQSSFTDDTVCTIAVADALVNDRDPAESLKDWGRRYWDNGGWGQRFASWLACDDMAPYNSYGNGAAMRVAPAGLLANSVAEVAAQSSRMTQVTHNHPGGMKGAEANRTGDLPRSSARNGAEHQGRDCRSLRLRPRRHPGRHPAHLPVQRIMSGDGAPGTGLRTHRDRLRGCDPQRHLHRRRQRYGGGHRRWGRGGALWGSGRPHRGMRECWLRDPRCNIHRNAAAQKGMTLAEHSIHAMREFPMMADGLDELIKSEFGAQTAFKDALRSRLRH
jgi:hypothetical protein